MWKEIHIVLSDLIYWAKIVLSLHRHHELSLDGIQSTSDLCGSFDSQDSICLQEDLKYRNSSDTARSF